MQYFSTNNRSIKADFHQATLQGQPSDKGLYFPEQIPQLSKEFIQNIRQYSKEKIAFEVIKPFIGDTIEDSVLQKIIAETVAFDFPLVPITDSISTLELFHGPTLAFKDVGARFMSRCLSYFAKDTNQKTTVLVATSGDTGGAVANAFFNVESVDVVILYPSGKVSEIQELQLTTLGNNITALEIDGTFDDCQQMVKDAFADKSLNEQVLLTSANSINVARWLPQQFYYFYAYQQWQEEQPPVISVPSGNFGNICAGLVAHLSGLPVKHFIAACNENDVASHYLATGEYVTQPSVQTLSNAMDVGAPSNFARILELFGHEHKAVRTVLNSYCISDELTIDTIQKVKMKYNYLLDPHGAVGFAALKMYQELHQESKGYFLETAHPVKFEVENIIGEEIELPEPIKNLLTKKKKSIAMEADAKQLKEFLLSRK
jgi:threonine synthase